MLFVGALLCVVVCQVSLVRAFMRVCVPYLTTRLDEELSLQQVRNLLPLGRLLLVPPELKALPLVLASTPTVSAGSVLGSEGDSCGVSSALVLACSRETKRAVGCRTGKLRAVWIWGKCRSRIGRTSTYEEGCSDLLLLGRKARVPCAWKGKKYASRSNILLTTGTEPSRAEFLCTDRSPLKFARAILVIVLGFVV